MPKKSPSRAASAAGRSLVNARWRRTPKGHPARKERARLSGIHTAIRRGYRLSPDSYRFAVAHGIAVPFTSLPIAPS